jgi:hypothetical protein
MMNPQINSQLSPTPPRRRPRGLGAPITLNRCDKFIIFLNLQGATVDDVKAQITSDWGSSVQGLTFSGTGTAIMSGTWVGSGPLTVPGFFTVAHNYGGNTGWANVQVLVESAINNGTDTTGACAAAPAPIILHQPPGIPIPSPPPPPPGNIVLQLCGPGLVYNKTLNQCVAVASGSAGAVGGSANASIYPLVQGHRTRVIVSAGSAALPSIYQNQTVATVQANLDGTGALLDVGPGKFVVATGGVTYPNASTLQVDFDYCGPNKNISAGGSITIDGTPVSVSFTDQGASPAGVCPPASGSSNTLYYVAGGVAATALAAGAWWKWGRKKKSR